MKRFLLIGGAAALATITIWAGSAGAGDDHKVTICHASGLDGTTKFETLNLDYHAVYGQAGHFYEDGTPRAGHEDDYLGPCQGETTTTTVARTTTTAEGTTSTSSPSTTTTSVGDTTTTSSTVEAVTTTVAPTTTSGATTTVAPTTLPEQWPYVLMECSDGQIRALNGDDVAVVIGGVTLQPGEDMIVPDSATRPDDLSTTAVLIDVYFEGNPTAYPFSVEPCDASPTTTAPATTPTTVEVTTTTAPAVVTTTTQPAVLPVTR